MATVTLDLLEYVELIDYKANLKKATFCLEAALEEIERLKNEKIEQIKDANNNDIYIPKLRDKINAKLTKAQVINLIIDIIIKNKIYEKNKRVKKR